MSLMSNSRTWAVVVIALTLVLPVAAPPGWALDVGGIASNFKVYEDVAEEDMEFYPYVNDHVALLWIWDWSMGCPI